MGSSAPGLDEIGAVAGALGTTEFFIEKDWHVVQILALIADRGFGGAQFSFSGGTALSKAHRLIHRFSEDIDFRCSLASEPASKGASRRARRQLYHTVQEVLGGAGYHVAAAPLIRDEHQFCQLQLGYPTILDDGASVGLRSHIQLEISFHPPRLPMGDQRITSFVAAHREEPGEVAAISCVDPVETGADKLSSLVWRMSAAHLGTRDAYQPDLMRHMHDLAVLAPTLLGSPDFVQLVKFSVDADLGRGRLYGYDSAAALNVFLDAITARESLPEDYSAFVSNYVYASPEEQVDYAAARDAVVTLCEHVLAN